MIRNGLGVGAIPGAGAPPGEALELRSMGFTLGDRCCGDLTLVLRAEEPVDSETAVFSSPGLGGLKPQKPGEINPPSLPLDVPQETLTQQISRDQPGAGDRHSQSLWQEGRLRQTGKTPECYKWPGCPLEGIAH